jgi:PKD repeat protein
MRGKIPIFFCLVALGLLVGVVCADTLISNAVHDGVAYDNDPAQLWADKRVAIGDGADDDLADYLTVGEWATATSDTYSQFLRLILTFNASTIPDDATITDATVSVYAESHDTGLGNLAVSLIDSTPANKMNLVGGDYDGTTFTRMADTDLTWAAFSSTNPNNWTLNALGLANIDITTTPFTYMLIVANEVDNSAPIWSSEKRFRTLFYSRAHAVGTKQPFITITYTLAGSAPPSSITNLANITTCNSINWAWTNPIDADFNHTIIYQNNTFLHNVSNTTTNDLWESLAELTEYIFSSKTCDLTGNCNTTFVNQTVNTTVCGSAPIADFTSNQTVICINETIQFNDTSINIPDAWHWILTGGWDSHDQNPTHTFDALGQYTVNLTASNAYGNDTESKIDYINVLDCSIIACNITLTPTLITTSFIKWEWDSGNNITYASIDGKNISSFDINSSTFIISDLIPDTRHMFKIYNETDCGVNTTYTLPEIIIQTEQEQFFGVINLYILFVIALICIGIAAFVPIVGLGASAFALIGLLSSVNNSFVMGFLFFIVLCAGIIACMADFGG